MNNTCVTPSSTVATITRRRSWTAVGTVVALVAVGATVNAAADSPAPASGTSTPGDTGWIATAILHDAAGTEVATVTFSGGADGTTVASVAAGVTEGTGGFHGLHIHANDDGGTCDAGADPPFSDVGGHWNPDGASHGHHAGDLPVVYVGAGGAAHAEAVLPVMSAADLDGRAVVLHAGPDNLANVPDRYETVGTDPQAGPDEMTLATGDSGGRYACGIIVVG